MSNGFHILNPGSLSFFYVAILTWWKSSDCAATEITVKLINFIGIRVLIQNNKVTKWNRKVFLAFDITELWLELMKHDSALI